MLIGNQEITKEQMPSYVDFSSNPKHLYGLIQDQLNSALQVNLQNAMTTPPQSKENKQNQWSNQ